MAIRDIVLRGFSNGTFNGSASLIVTQGYGIGEPPAEPAPCPYRPARVESSDTYRSRTEPQPSYASRVEKCT